jgi:hypothetical protein
MGIVGFGGNDCYLVILANKVVGLSLIFYSFLNKFEVLELSVKFLLVFSD